MSRVIATYASGPALEWQKVSLPTIAAYAVRHGYDFVVPGEEFYREVGCVGSHPAWRKIPLIARLCLMYEEVLWIDADVVIRQMDVDIALDAVGTGKHFLVVHHTPDGAVPNTGVWFLRGIRGDEISTLWDMSSFSRSACWWEQAALISSLGGDPDATPVSVPPSDKWAELPYHWNPHVHDARGVPADCRFFHATCYLDRVAAMQEMLR